MTRFRFSPVPLLTALTLAAPAAAGDNVYADPATWTGPRTHTAERPGARQTVRRHFREAPRVRAWVKVAPVAAGDAHCLAPQRAVGTPHASEAAALESAVRHWQALARHDWGELYTDIRQARDARHRCARAETNETAAGRAVEALTGGDVWRTRCEIVARPCRKALEPMR